MIKMREQTKPGTTPKEITVSMIDQDLKDGISKPEMAIKYGIKPWEVDEMFKHPTLKGRRPSRKKALSFSFVDDTITEENKPLLNTESEEWSGDGIAIFKTDPNQVTLEQAIEESTKEIETAVDRLADVNNAIVDMLGPTDETPEEMVKSILETDDEVEIPSFEDTMDLVKEQQQEEEIEVDDNTFDL